MIKASLRTKFLVVMSSLLFAAVFSYLLMAVNLFDQDKTTYIYEGNATLVNTLAAETLTNLRSIEKTLDLLSLTANQTFTNESQRRKILDRVFGDEPDIIYFQIRDINRKDRVLSTLVDLDFLKPHGLNSSYFSKLNKAHPISNDDIFKRQLIVENVAMKNGVPLLAFAKPYSSSRNNVVDQAVVAYLRQDRRMKLFSRSDTFTTYLLDSYGNVLAHPDAGLVMSRKSYAGEPLFKQIRENKFETGVKTVKRKSGEVIFGFSKLAYGGLIVVSEISRDKAFLASKRLIEKSIYFALLIISVAFVVSILFSKKITSSITRLYTATQEIMRGNFLVNVDVKSRDEVGALSLSFNRMAGEISRLMEETADKARMEKELETAQLVQDNFFPVDHVDLGSFEVSAFYKPASECGGDWWGHIHLDDKLIILIGDATGHGVPSALITAAAQSCCSTLEEVQREIPEVNLSPSSILEKLNTAIFKGGRGHVKMTFFAGIIDMNTGEMTYANASHDMPMICHLNPEDPEAPRTKKNIEICTGKTGMILGHELYQTYPEHKVKIAPGEVIVLFTDGVLECKNEQNEMYGKGKFLRSFFKSAPMSAVEIKDALMDKALKFFGDRERDDDVTLVVIKHKSEAASKGLPQAS